MVLASHRNCAEADSPMAAGAPAGVTAEEQGLGTQQSGLWGPRQAR